MSERKVKDRIHTAMLSFTIIRIFKNPAQQRWVFCDKKGEACTGQV